MYKNQNIPSLNELSNCIRFLSMDAVQKAKSGHPGMPMGMSDIATVLFKNHLVSYAIEFVREEIYQDTDENGKSDQAYIDEDEDKKPDVIAYDYNQDGEWDKFEKIS